MSGLLEKCLTDAGICMLGLIAGEFLHRVSFILEEYFYHSDDIIYLEQNVTPLTRVFGSRNNQQWKLAAVVCFSGMVLKANIIHQSSFVLKTIQIFAVISIWCLLRMFGITDNMLEDLGMISADLGPGLAINYWYGFLETVLKDNEDEDDIQTKLRREFEGCPDRNLHIFYDKIILLLPSTCEYQPDNEVDQVHRSDRQIQFSYFNEGRFKEKSMYVHWIYDSDEQADNFQSRRRKIYFLSDFPTILQSAMGSNDLFDKKDMDKCINSFCRTLQKLSFASCSHESYVPLKYNVGEVPLSQRIREIIQQNDDN